MVILELIINGVNIHLLLGRWHSKAFLNYIKAPREVRARMAEELARRVAKTIKLQ